MLKKEIFLTLFFLFYCASTVKQEFYIEEKNKKEEKPLFDLNSKSSVERCKAVIGIIEKASKLFNLEVSLLSAVAKVESNFNTNAVSSAGAIGIMQIMPKTGKKFECKNLFQPEENIFCGAKVLKRFIEYYNNNIIYALSGYNAGHFFADRAKKQNHLPKNFDYVERVLIMRARFMDSGCNFEAK